LDGASVHRHARLFIDRLNVKRPVYRHPRDEPPRANEILKSAALAQAALERELKK